MHEPRGRGDSRASTGSGRKNDAYARVTGVSAVLNGLNARACSAMTAAAAAANQFHRAAVFCEIGQGDGARARARQLGGGGDGGGGATARGDADTDRSPTTAAPAATLDGCSRGGVTTTTTRRYVFRARAR